MKNLYVLIFFVLASSLGYSQGFLRYHFENTLTETGGIGPVLTVLGNPGVYVIDTLNEISNQTKRVYRFETNSGLQFNNNAAGGYLGENYTIELYFVFDDLTSWKRVVDWKNRKTDRGAYVYYGKLNFYNYVYSNEAPVLPGEYTYYVITRDSISNKLMIYTDAKVGIDFIDDNLEGILDEDHVLNFFYDDLVVPDEASSGAVALLNIYNYVLDSTAIKQNFINLQQQVFAIHETGNNNRDIRISPNPVRDRMSISLNGFSPDEPVQISLINLLGSAVLQDHFAAASVLNIDLFSLSLPEGMYLVRIEQGAMVRSQKVMILR